jgi:hypothetical protein
VPKKLLKSKRNPSQNNPLENNVKQVPTKSSTLFYGGLFWRQLRFGGNCSTLISGGLFWRQLRFGVNCSTLFSGGLFWRQLRLGGTTTKKPTQPHICTGSDLVGTGSTLFSGGLEPKKLNTTPQLYFTPKYISSM